MAHLISNQTGLLYAYPLGLYIILMLLTLAKGGQSSTRLADRDVVAFKTIWYLQLGLALSSSTSAILLVAPFISGIRNNHGTSPSEAFLICYIAVSLYFGAGLLPDPDGPFQPIAAHFGTWIYAFSAEVFLILTNQPFISDMKTAWLLLSSLRIAALGCMCCIYLWIKRGSLQAQTIETERLLNSAMPKDTFYGAIPTSANQRKGGWPEYLIGFRILFPYIWPSRSRKQQFILLVSLLLMIAQRIINILVPYQLGVLIESIGVGNMPYKEVGLYVLYRGIQGQQGVLGSFRAILWITVSQSLYRRLTCAAFEHILSLSLDFHLSKKLGEVLSALNKGSSLNTFLDSFAFQLFPMVFDLGVAAVYFFVRFDALYSLILISVMWSYIYMTIYMAKWRAKARREMALKDREMDATKMDTMLSYETVHHNNAVPTEVERFGDHVTAFQKAEFSVLFSLNALNITQNMILTLGVLLVVLLSAFQISVGAHTVAMFVSILAYFTQLQAPLQFFGSFYNQVQNNLIDAERMLDLFKLKPTIIDSQTAEELDSCAGEISFDNVTFSYGYVKPALSDVSFCVPIGTSTAIVGESGSGKSTCLKLLFRFYDVASGSIRIDGRDIRDFRIASYRSHFGVVPQDTILFNSSIRYNLQYARLDAREDEIYAACRAASIHDKILSFPRGYDTIVGERGLRLSGGEKQRIAIARAILKNPQIILLDEATASLDTHTEKQIQAALETATKGRTTITVAHRLSTITKHNQILVFHEGSIVERGRHEDLLELGGRYKEMWEKQTRIGD
ncbi:ABC heavy metal transporter [Lojkania enalia]|uniref:ABC heavy metal transporter n=1 Tax=Lojkania enalia TaxID=147567 RepID=A0A9P4KBH9_9PLEO|nr:ABC heavy metal transporter [Didymosphaeria enalia]